MKKLLFSLGLTAAAFTFLPGAASAHEMDTDTGTGYSESWQDSKCDRIADKIERLNGKFDQDNERRLERQQRLIDRQNELGCDVSGTIVDELVENGNFTTLVAAVQAADLDGALSAPGDKTVFAPTDQAFAALPEGTVEGLLNDIPALTNILTYHVVSGKVDAETASTVTTATALNGKELKIRSDDCGLYINDSKVVLYDIMTSNGIIHVIDAVLLPN